MMYDRREREYYRAKMKAARRICKGWVKPIDLPSNAEIRDQVEILARMHESDDREGRLREMRLEALRLMRLLHRFRPRLIGSVLTGHIRQGSDIDIHVFSDHIDPITRVLDREGILYDVQRKQVRKHGTTRTFTHIHIRDRFSFELTMYPARLAHYVFRSSVTGKAMERASEAELAQLIQREYSDVDLEDALGELENQVDRFQLYESLLLPLENIKENRRYHPEADALYHSLQVFDLACDALPYDEEFLLAALLHDVGKAIEGQDHVEAALEALDGFITERTAWLIEHHMDAHALLDGTLGVRARRRLQQSESFEELMLLARCDREGRQQGVEVTELDDALDYVRGLSETFGE